MNHAEKVKELIQELARSCSLLFLDATVMAPPAKDKKDQVFAAIDEMQAEIDRLVVIVKQREAEAIASLSASMVTDAAMKERAVITHIQQNLPPLPEGAGDYFLDGDKWIRCADRGPKERGEGA